MPSIASLAALRRATDEFPVTRLDLLIEPAARAAARESVQEAGLLLPDQAGRRRAWPSPAGGGGSPGRAVGGPAHRLSGWRPEVRPRGPVSRGRPAR